LRRFGDRARFIFEPHFLNQAQARNIGLRAATTRFAVVMDNDVLVRSGWLRGLLGCQRETGAVMVVVVSRLMWKIGIGVLPAPQRDRG
jgi:hypothetical protein